MPELKKVRMASVGVQTIGSPRRLNEVFITTGTPVRLPNSWIRSPIERIDVALHRLRARAAVHVRHRRESRRAFPAALAP